MAWGRYGASQSSTVASRCLSLVSGHPPSGIVPPGEVEPGPQRVGQPHVERGQPRVHHPLDQCRDGVVAGRRAARVVADGHVAESRLDPEHEVVALLVPDERLAPLDVVGEGHLELLGIEACGETDAGTGAIAVEVGRDDERFASERIVLAHPRAAAGAQLELAELAAPDRDTIGEAERQHAAGSGRRRRRRARGGCGRGGRCRATGRGRVRRRGDRPGRRARRHTPAAPGTTGRTGSSSARPRSTSRSSTIAATTQASGCRFGGAATIIRARRGWTGSPSIGAPGVGDGARWA